MLTYLSIQNIVLIDRLDLAFDEGLIVLTGETGAGKSILLDSLALATGARADRALVRQGETKGRVTAVFEPVLSVLQSLSVMTEGLIDAADSDQVILRRDITSDGRSKCFINDMPVSVARLADVGSTLLEINGQHDDRGLMNAATHRRLLDRFGVPTDLISAMIETDKAHSDAINALADLRARVADAKAQEDFYRHGLEELDALGPAMGEEQELAERRAAMMAGSRMADDLADLHKSFTADDGVDAAVRALARRADRIAEGAEQLLEPLQESLNRAAIELDEALRALEHLIDQTDFDPAEMDRAEERLFEYRRLARKHDCQPDDLANLRDRFADLLQTVTAADAEEAALIAAVDKAHVAKLGAAKSLSEARKKAALSLDEQVNGELGSLKLGGASFATALDAVEETAINRHGAETVQFTIRTNAGSAFGPLSKIASGGELSRFQLALKVALAKADQIPTIIFDEIDRGVGGATAAAVAERLKLLSGQAQVLLVTHSPQVAARGDLHMQIAKQDVAGQTRSHVARLSDQERREEIARMLSGATVTDEARAAADALLVPQDS